MLYIINIMVFISKEKKHIAMKYNIRSILKTFSFAK